MSVSVVIINFNSGDLLAKCLRHLEAQTVVPERVIVVDNASSDGSTEKLVVGGRLSIMKMTKNIGFAAANNQALRLCATKWVALLNADAFPEPDWIEELLEASRKYPGYAMFGSRQVAAENPDRLDGDGDCYHISGVVWREGHGRQFTKTNRAWEVFTPCAAAALYRTDFLREIGGFDEDFFCYLEDVDLGFRMRLKGHRCLQVPSAVVHHLGAATTGGQRGDFATYYGHRNLVWTFFKNLPAPLFWLFLPLHIGANFFSLILGVFRGQGRIIFKAKRDALYGLRRIWRKRCFIQKSRTVSAFDIFKILDKRIFRTS
jgi:GT2 family glycosyltransferase